jgi:hypothetical protein
MCKKIHRGGNAEQYHADKKYKEAVAVAVEACAEDTKADASAIDILEDTVRRSNRVLGPNHPDSEQMQDALDDARAKLALDSS